MGLQAYQQILDDSRVANNPELNRRVQEVGRRIAAVSPQPGWDWQFTLLENAVALRAARSGSTPDSFRSPRTTPSPLR